jgi:hypothetical protein
VPFGWVTVALRVFRHDKALSRRSHENGLSTTLIEVITTAIVPEDRCRAPEAFAQDSFEVSDSGFNIQS